MPDVKAKNLSFSRLLRDTVQLFFLHWRRHLVLSLLCAVPLGILMALHYFDPLTDFFRSSLEQPDVRRMPDGTPSMTVSAAASGALLPMRFLSLAALTVMIISAFAASWWSGIFELRQLPEGRGRRYFEDFTAVLARLVLVGAIMLAVAFGIGLINTALVQILTPVLRPLGAAQFVRFLISAALQVILLGVGLRLVLAVPPVLWGEHIPFARAWGASAGTTLNLGAAALLLAVPPLALTLIVGLLLGGGAANAGPVIEALTMVIMGPVIFLYHALQLTLAAVLFQKLREAGRL